MKKFYIVLFAFIAVCMPASALSVKVTSMQDFSSEKPSATMKVVTLERAELDNGLVFEEGTVIKGEIFDVKGPTRGKINASFKFRPISYSFNGKMTEIKDNQNIWAKYAPYKPLDKGELAISAVSTTGSMVLKVPGFGQAVSFAKGAVKNPDGNRLKSGATQIYKDSFLSYVEEGKDVNIKKDEMFILKFKVKEDEDAEKEAEAEAVDVHKEQTAPVEIKNTVPAAPLPKPEVVPAEPEQSNIHAVDPYDVLKEVESAQQTK